MNAHPGLAKKLIKLCSGLLALTFALNFVVASNAHKGGTRLAAGNMQLGGTSKWEVLAPVSYKNLMLFPVRAARGDAGARATNDYVTLDEGTKNGTVAITERGSNGNINQMARHGRRNGRLQGMVNQLTSGNDSDSVNQLALINRSGKKLLLLAGEVITGGKQDRIVEADLIIPPISIPVSLNVFCVEPGRWQNRSVSQTIEPPAPARLSAAAQTAAVVAPTPEPSAAPPAVVKQADGFSSLNAISHPKLRAVAQDKKDQSSVWDEVRANNTKLGTTTSTETYREVYDKKEVGDQMQQYVSAFEKEITGSDIVGVVVARGGQLVWVDCFASDALFAKYWPKLLKSYIIDALGEQTSAKPPTVEQALRYLQESPVSKLTKTTTDSQAGIFNLVKTADASSAIFALYDTSLPTPLLLHFNKMQR